MDIDVVTRLHIYSVKKKGKARGNNWQGKGRIDKWQQVSIFWGQKSGRRDISLQGRK